MPELLAPAGSMEALLAALRCGADAVYVGAERFSARANAENFSKIELLEAARLCHLYGAKLYLAVNTLLFDNEFDELDALLISAADAGIDACIVQDFGVAAYIKRRIPNMPLHASTQMTIHTVAGVRIAADMGFSRVVVARELSEKKIAELCAAGEQVGVEIEVFVHGAHCMSVSGQCWMSAAMGGRSANRGCCAQPCRLPFTADPAKPNENALSLRDMCLVSYVDELCKIGVKSLKIEGRMKRPEYVAAAVSAYRNALNGQKPDLAELRAVFSRSGFTDGYFSGKRKNMFGIREKEDVLAAKDVLSSIRKKYQNPRKCVELNAQYMIFENEPARLTVMDSDGNQVTVSGAIPQIAERKSTDHTVLEQSFSKLGNTIYTAGTISCNCDENLMLPASALNAMRRDACDALDAIRISNNTPKYDLMNQSKTTQNRKSHVSNPKIWLQVRSIKQLDELGKTAEQIEMLLLPLHLAEMYASGEQIIPISRCVLVPPRFVLDEQRVEDDLKLTQKRGFCHLLSNHIGIVKIAKDLGMTVHGGLGLHLTNSETVNVLSGLGLADALISPETNRVFASKLENSVLPLGMFAYGRLPLMLARNCPIRSQVGCSACKHQLVDRKRAELFVDCTRYADTPDYAEIFNAEPTWLADKQENYNFVSYLLLNMTDESSSEVNKIVCQYLGILKPQSPASYTRGIRLQIHKGENHDDTEISPTSRKR